MATKRNSTKSPETQDRETSQAIAKRLTVADLKRMLADKMAANQELRETIKAQAAEISRKERVINHYAVQLKGARTRIAALSDRPTHEIAQRVDWANAAKQYCEDHGVKSVSREDLQAYVRGES